MQHFPDTIGYNQQLSNITIVWKLDLATQGSIHHLGEQIRRFGLVPFFYAIHLPLYAIIILFNNTYLQCVDFQYYDLPPAEALFHISLEIDDLTIVIADRAGRGHLTDK